jgi:thiol-disulfide isomerase/thioredoxin
MNDVEDAEEAIETDEDPEEARVPKVLKSPLQPTAREVEEHNLTHLPFRDWCPHCIMGKARNIPHKKQKDKEHLVPHIHVDYGFLGTEEDEEKMIIQVARDEESRALLVHAVPRKGLAHVHGAEQLIRDVEELGCKKFILKADNEPATHALQEELKKQQQDETLLGNSPVGESQSNGLAERAVQAAGGHIRVVKLALESSVGIRFPAIRPIMSWIAKHAADMIDKFHVGPDGKTSYEIMKDEKYSRSLVEFGEKIFFRHGKLSENKLEARWEEGIFLGTEWRTGAAHVGAKDGVLEAHGIRRVPQEVRWNSELVQSVKGFPWRQKNPVDGVPGIIRVRHLTEEKKMKGPEVKPEDEPRMSQVRLPKKLFEDHGYTSGCPGCRALLHDMVPRSHKAECRERMEKILSQTEEGKKRKDRHEDKMNEHIATKIAQSIAEEIVEEQPSGSGDRRQKRARDQEDDGGDEGRAQEFPRDNAGTKETVKKKVKGTKKEVVRESQLILSLVT